MGEAFLMVCEDCKICYGYGFEKEKHECKECDPNCLIIKGKHGRSYGVCKSCRERKKAKQ